VLGAGQLLPSNPASAARSERLFSGSGTVTRFGVIPPSQLGSLLIPVHRNLGRVRCRPDPFAFFAQLDQAAQSSKNLGHFGSIRWQLGTASIRSGARRRRHLLGLQLEMSGLRRQNAAKRPGPGTPVMPRPLVAITRSSQDTVERLAESAARSPRGRYESACR